jgi:hypothetical protein
MEVKDRYDEIFALEVEALCYALTNYPGEIFDTVFYIVLGDLKDSFRTAIECNVVFDILDISTRLSKAAKYLIDERDIAFEILNLLPNPAPLSEEEQFILAQLVDQVEQAYGGAIEFCEKKWSTDKKEAA